MKQVFFLWLAFCVFSGMLPPRTVHAQEIQGATHRATVVGGDTIPVIDLSPVVILAPRIFQSRSEQMRYYRMVHNVKRAYPYAYLAGLKLREYEPVLDSIGSDAERRRFVRRIEEEIRGQFEEDLVRLTRTQGLILIKLIDRETSKTSYDILRDYRGGVPAVFWQSLARIFGYNLRTPYDPEGEDKLIEEIVLLIESGVL
jgi:hypothetical protein